SSPVFAGEGDHRRWWRGPSVSFAATSPRNRGEAKEQRASGAIPAPFLLHPGPTPFQAWAPEWPRSSRRVPWSNRPRIAGPEAPPELAAAEEEAAAAAGEAERSRKREEEAGSSSRARN